MAEHSPTPWRLQIDEVGPEFTDVPIVDANGEPVVITDSGCYPPDNATADLIVEAVNERDRLRELVRRMLPCVESTIGTLELNTGDDSGFPASLQEKLNKKAAELRALLREAREALGEGEP